MRRIVEYSDAIKRAYRLAKVSMEDTSVKRLIILTLCLLVLVSTACLADGYGLKGRSEILAAGAWLKADAGEDDLTVTAIAANYGYFITKNWELQAGLIYADGDAGDLDGNALLFAPAAVYHFVKDTPTSTVPYLGAGFIYGNIDGGDESDSSFELQFMAGAKFFIGGDYTQSNKAIFVEYRHTNVDMFEGSADIDAIWTGISVFLK